MSSIFHTTSTSTPSTSGTTKSAELTGALRDCTPQGKGLRKLSEGDIAVVDAPDMSRREAQLLVEKRPSAVVNIAGFSSGNIPNYGPQLLLDADILLFEGAGASTREAFRDGKKATLTADGEITIGKKVIAQAEPLDQATVESSFDTSQRELVDHMEAYFGNTIEFIHTESPLLVDGVGVPELGDVMDGRKVLVVSPTLDTREKVSNLRHFIREFRPIVIGVGSASDTLLDLGYSCDFIVGDPADISADNLRGDARVVLPADPDGHAAGLERIQDLGVGAVTFPAATDSPTDLAILLAVFHNAETIVTAGDTVDLDRMFAGADHAAPPAMLARLKAGDRIVDSRVIENLYRPTSGGGVAWAWAILGLLVAVATIVIIVGVMGNGTFVDNLINTWNNFALAVQNLFKN
nr:Thiamine pyrophosphokinase C terminal [Streptococcus thermophilus]